MTQTMPPAAPANVPNYLWQAIVATLLCCLPFGVPAIVYASKVNSLTAVGNLAAAQEASRKAKFWCWMSFGFGLAAILLSILLQGAVWFVWRSTPNGPVPTAVPTVTTPMAPEAPSNP